MVLTYYQIPELTLDIIWNNWLRSRNENTKYYSKHYRFVGRRNSLSQSFESWIFSHGGVIVQVDGGRIIQFNNEKQLTWFLMKYGN